MARFGVALLVGMLLLGVTGCDSSERIARLEKQNKELLEKVSARNATADYDLQVKCSRDANAWFQQNWAPTRFEKSTKLLDYSNHYNKSMNKCFVLVEYHFDEPTIRSQSGTWWANSMGVWDVYENAKYADFNESHITYFKPELKPEDRLDSCEVLGVKCKSVEEFNSRVRPYMSN